MAIALALKENFEETSLNRGKLVSLESESYWAERNAQDMHPDLLEFCEISYSPVVEATYHETQAFKYSYVPENLCGKAYELVYLDGPKLRKQTGWEIAGDLLDIEDQLSPKVFGVIDGRHANAGFLRAHFQKLYRFRYRLIPGVYTFDACHR